MRAQIESITFRSSKCYYCDNKWEHELHVEPIDATTKELTGKLLDIFVCDECKDTKTTEYKDRIRYDSSTSRKIGEEDEKDN